MESVKDRIEPWWGLGRGVGRTERDVWGEEIDASVAGFSSCSLLGGFYGSDA